MRRAVRYLIRDREGRELIVPSLADLSHLYRHGLLGEDDLVRTATGARWVRAGDMPALAGHREQRREWRTVLDVLAAAVTLVAALALLLRGR